MDSKEEDLSLNESEDVREDRKSEHSHSRYDDEQQEYNQQQEMQPYEMMRPSISFFQLQVTGQFESGEFPYSDGISLKFEFVTGNRWKVVEGQTTGTSQYGFKGHGHDRRIVWNYPFDITYAWTNIKEWPQIIVYWIGKDFLRRNIIQAYGCVHVPTQPGKHTRHIRLFTPITSSLITSFLGWVTGTHAEYKDASNLLSKGEGREVTRVQSAGTMKISFQITQRNLEKFGYITSDIKKN